MNHHLSSIGTIIYRPFVLNNVENFDTKYNMFVSLSNDVNCCATLLFWMLLKMFNFENGM